MIKPTEPKVTMAVQMPRGLYQLLAGRAAEEQRSKGAVVRLALDAYLRASETTEGEEVA